MTRARGCVGLLGLMVSLNIVTPVFAESAPVYDADSMQQQFDATQAVPEQEDLPPPPPPGQESVFVPMGSPVKVVPQSAPVTTSSLPISERLNRVEQQVTVMQNKASASRVESLQNEVQVLRGQVEQLTHQLQQLQTQQKSMYSDLDKRLAQKSGGVASEESISTLPESAPAASATKAAVTGKKLAKASIGVVEPIDKEKTKSSAAVKTPVADKSADQPNVAEEQQIYQTAYDLIKAKKYSQAVDALQGMLKKYPSGQFAANAHYWLGELYGLMGKSDKALVEFNTVVKQYPHSPRISDAQLKVGLLYAAQSKWSEAKSAFKQVINRYPGTASSRLAAEQLKQIKQAGN